MEVNTPYIFVSERIGFRWWSAEDLQLAIELWGDPQVTRLFSKEPFSKQQIQERLETEIERARVHAMQYWPMFELDGGGHIGCAGLRPYDLERKIYELGFHLRPQYWGKGFATEAASAVLYYGRTTLGAVAFFAGHHPENASSRKVLLKLGFKQTGAEFYEPTGLHHPSYLLEA